ACGAAGVGTGRRGTCRPGPLPCARATRRPVFSREQYRSRLMHFAELFVRRPVLASMVSLGLVLMGVIGYTRLPVREFPDADAPIVSVTAVLPGASPQVVESSVTDVLEEELSS